MSERRARANASVLAEVEANLPELRDAGDFNGLLRAQALAQVVASTSEGALHRKATRLAKKAGAAAEKARKVEDDAARFRAKAAAIPAPSRPPVQPSPVLNHQPVVEHESPSDLVGDLVRPDR